MRSDLLEPSRTRGKGEREREPNDPETQTGREGRQESPADRRRDGRERQPGKTRQGEPTGAPCVSDAVPERRQLAATVG